MTVPPTDVGVYVVALDPGLAHLTSGVEAPPEHQADVVDRHAVPRRRVVLLREVLKALDDLSFAPVVEVFRVAARTAGPDVPGVITGQAHEPALTGRILVETREDVHIAGVGSTGLPNLELEPNLL